MSTSDPSSKQSLRALANRDDDPNGRTLNANERHELDEARRVGVRDKDNRKI